MRAARAPMVIAGLLGVGCGTADEGVSFDPTRQNIQLQGSFSDLIVEVTGTQVVAVEREYRGPVLPGTDPADEIPDIAATRLCEVSLGFVVELDGTEWDLEIELENFVPEALGPGSFAVIGVDTEPSSNETSVEMEMSSEVRDIERTAIGGTVDIEIYDGDDTHPENPDVRLGGSIGVIFQLDFGAGERIDGSAFADFTETTIEGQDC